MSSNIHKPFGGGIANGVKTVFEAIGYYFKKPALLLFFIYAGIINFVLSGIGFALVKLICWLDKSTQSSIWCKVIKFSFTQGLNFDKKYFLLLHQDQLQNKDLVFGIIIFCLAIILSACSIYVSYYAMVGLARYIAFYEDENIASPTKALSMSSEKKRVLWQWSFLIFFLLFVIHYLASKVFALLTPAHQIKVYMWGIVPATTALLLLITFYAIPYLAYRDLNAWQVLKKQSTAFAKAPVATLTSWLMLSFLLFFLPSFFYKTKMLSAIGHFVYMCALLIIPVTQVLLFRKLRTIL